MGNKEMLNNGRFILYCLERERGEYVLSYASFDVQGDDVSVACYVNDTLLKELKMRRTEARVMWKSLVEDGYKQQDAQLN